MAQQLKTLAAVAKDMSSVPRTHIRELTTTLYIYLAPGDLMLSRGTCTYVNIHTDTDR